MAKMTTAARSGQLGLGFFLASFVPLLAGICFLIGSGLFWPRAGESYHTDGATFFLIGSLVSCIVPSLDLCALSQLNTLLDAERLKDAKHAVGFDIWRPAYWPGPETADYEYLYLSQMIQIQIITAAFFLVADISFVGGSALWFPQLDADYMTQGAWLFIFGSGMNIAGSSMAYVTSRELQKITNPNVRIELAMSHQIAHLSFWTDEQAAMSSSMIYLIGNVLFVIGTALLFPVISSDTDNMYSYIGVVSFVVGSVLFFLASLIDSLVMWRRTTDLTNANKPIEGEALLQNEAPS